MDKTFVQKRMMEYARDCDRSMAEISKKLGRDESYISGATKGRFEPKLSDVLGFCELLKIAPTDFFREQDLTWKQQLAISLIPQMTDNQLDLIIGQMEELNRLNSRIK